MYVWASPNSHPSLPPPRQHYDPSSCRHYNLYNLSTPNVSPFACLHTAYTYLILIIYLIYTSYVTYPIYYPLHTETSVHIPRPPILYPTFVDYDYQLT